MTAIHLLLVNYPGVSKAALAGLEELFAYTAHLHRQQGLPEISLTTQRDAAAFPPKPDAVILPPAFGNNHYLSPTSSIVDYLQSQPQTTLMASACAGAFYLASAGVLKNRRVTTHLGLERKLQDFCPDCTVQADQILIRDGNVMTAGGLMAWIDLGLELIATFSTIDIMRDVGRHFVVDTGRREQRYYRAFHPPLNHGDADIEQAQFLIERTFTAPIRISGLAQTIGLSERTFLRRFEKATGLTPLLYVQHLRLQSAQRALENTAASVDQISYSIGYENAGSFRKLFKRHTGLSPSQYRLRLKR